MALIGYFICCIISYLMPLLNFVENLPKKAVLIFLPSLLCLSLIGMDQIKTHLRLGSSVATLLWSQSIALQTRFSSNSTVISQPVAFLCSVIMVCIIYKFMFHLLLFKIVLEN